MPHILLIEDNQVTAQALEDTLEAQGWRVTRCGDGAVAMLRLAGKTIYDLLLCDIQLPSVSGLELVRYARTLPQCKEMPIIMFSASECSREARQAGANEFLRKPQDIGKIVETISRLLSGVAKPLVNLPDSTRSWYFRLHSGHATDRLVDAAEVVSRLGQAEAR